jgi:ERCC4-related helicase
MSFAVGTLVKARDREWVVLPESEGDLLVLRPLGGTEDEVTGIYTPLEKVEPAEFDLPDPSQLGDYRSCRMLRDAVRLGFRSSAGPFRSFARIGVEPRPYQLVPLLMALKLDPIRLLIADDVGIGKTIEACLIARELIDRGEQNRLTVLCPPQLAEQWQKELQEKFHIHAELVLPSTVTRLERNRMRQDQSVFDLYPFTVVSTDFIKADRRRDEFLRTCPDLVIVDEAHTCAFGGDRRGGRMQRNQVVTGLAAKEKRHLILVTATPHSGKDETFRSLLHLLDPKLANLPDDLSGAQNVEARRQLAQYFVQRRRGDILNYMDTDTVFATREDAEESYGLSPAYHHLFERVLQYAKETTLDPEGGQHRRRVRWWSALALLRSLASSPAAAAATLRTRAATAESETEEAVDEIGKRTVLDLTEDEPGEGMDVAPGGDIGNTTADEKRARNRLLAMAREADKLYGKEDAKLQKMIPMVRGLLKDGYHPILFCRFIPTAEYVAEALRDSLKKGTEVIAVTGHIPPAEREERIQQLGKADQRVLVCTDCLSEGINLQDHFDAVIHYDLSWNPTRHEQREGRVDRYGQPSPHVRVLTYYGVDNQIDGIVLDVLIRKHQEIRRKLGYTVPVPVDAEDVIEAVFEGLLLREGSHRMGSDQMVMFEEYFKPKREDVHAKWEAAGGEETRSRSMFAQERIHVDEVAQEMEAVRSAIGSGVDVSSFVHQALQAHGAVVSGTDTINVDLTETPRALRETLDNRKKFKAGFNLPVEDGADYLTRTHPIVEGLASHVMNTALDRINEGKAKRCGVIRTSEVERRTTVLLIRFRYHIITTRDGQEYPLLAEDCATMAFTGAPAQADWQDDEVGEHLLLCSPNANVNPDQAKNAIQRILDDIEPIRVVLEERAEARGAELLETHRRVRTAAQMRGVTYRVEPKMPPDILGLYVYLPVQK